MNNKPNTAEEISEDLDKKIVDLIKAYVSESPHTPSGTAFQKSLFSIMQEHTNQTLDRLKGKIEDLEGIHLDTVEDLLPKKLVIQLIKEVRDE